MRIVLLGPQGAGKGTQAQRISEMTGAKHISTGDLVRAEIKSGSAFGQTLTDYNDRGDLVPDEVIVQMMRPYLDEADSWILDGFPRNRPQADLLEHLVEEIGAELDAAVVLEAPDEALIERLSGRRMSEATGKIYHVEYDPPPESSEEDPGPYIQRKDDREESIQHRLEIYHEQTEPLKYYFAEKGILVTVDATQGIPEVTEDILTAVGYNP
jgi:adenylate kinase